MPAKKLFLQGTVLGFILWAVLPMGVAQAAPSISIGRGSNQQATGVIDVPWSASSSVAMKWAKAEILGSHLPNPNCVQREPYGCDYNDDAPSGTTELGNTYTWDTNKDTPYNGTYTFRVTGNDVGGTSFEQISVLVNNLPQAPSWATGINSGNDDNGRPFANIAWSYDGHEPDLREFQIERNGPDGKVLWAVYAANPSVSGACTKSSSTYSCTDNAFSKSGSYTYKVWALRSSPVSGSQACRLNPADGGKPYPNGATAKCVGRSTSTTQGTSLEMPANTGGGGTSGGGGGGGGGTSGTGTSGGATGGIKPPPGGITIVGGQRRTLPGNDTDYRDFYTGSYEKNLPYQDRILLQPGGKIPFGGGRTETSTQVEALGSDKPVGVPLKDRAVILPLAGGLLLFLGAAHVKRLLTDR